MTNWSDEDLQAHLEDDMRIGVMGTRKDIIRLRTGKCVRRVVRDRDFMMLCDGRQYARCTINREEIEIARPRDQEGNGVGEWLPAAYLLETPEE